MSIIFLSWNIVSAQDQCKPVGWATQNGGVTGGGSATPTVVTSYAALKTALTTKTVKVVHVSGTITFPLNGRITIQDTDGKTVIGLAGSKMVSVDLTSSGSGILYVKRTTNLILRNLTFEGPGAYDEDGNDNLTVDDCQNIWVDHCDFQDGMDGNFDIKNMSNFISITWCKFGYKKKPITGGSGGSNDHRFSDLIGSSDTATGDADKLNITFQYCWWAEGCVERMPRVRFGKLHIANCLYNSSVSNSCIRAGYKANLLIESNVFIGVKNPIDLYKNDFTAVTEKNNIFTSTSGGKTGSGTAFTPPYTLAISNASAVQGMVTNTTCGAGATMDSPTQCGCGTQTANKIPTAALTAPSSGSNTCIGTSITISANAQDSDGSISKVDFYNGTTLLGSDNTSPYSITYTPNTTGTLSITATATDNSGGTGSSAANKVTVSALPIASISSATTNLCTTPSIVLSTGGGSSYIWFKDNKQVGTAATFSATEAGTYTVEITNSAGCKALSAARTLTGTPQAIPIITTPSTSICSGSSVKLSTSSGSSYKWFNGTTSTGTSATIDVIQTGDYTVEVTNAGGCKATSAIKTITVNALPVITQNAQINNGTWTATDNATVCATGTIALGPWPTQSGSWTWTGPNNFNSTVRDPILTNLAIVNTGTYTASYTDANGCKASSAFKLTVAAIPTASISSATTNLCTAPSIILSTATESSYIWFKDNKQVGTAATFAATEAGAYTVEITNSSGCKAISAARTLTSIPQATPTVSSATTNLCTTSSIVLSTGTGSSYIWFKDNKQVGTAATFTAAEAGAYTVEITNGSGCKAISAARTLTGTTQATPTISSATTNLCTTPSIVLSTGAGTSYIWFKDNKQVGTAATFTATEVGAYTVEITNSSGCKAISATRTLTGTTQATPTISSATTNLCTTPSIVLSTGAGLSYIWFKDNKQVGTAATFTAAEAGAYTVEITNSSGCKAISAARTLTLLTQATPTISAPSSSICAGNSVVLTTSLGASYKWFNGTSPVGTNTTLTVQDAGAYTVEVTNNSGCKATSQVKQITVTSTITWYADTDNDGTGDVASTILSCTQPQGYVGISGDACPNDVNKTAPGNCGCGNTEASCMDCAGIPNGTAFYDNCSICVGGTTSNTACVTTATLNGTTANITVVPQPFDINTSISIANLGMIESITIINAAGAVVETKQHINNESITLGESLASGLYTVMIQSETGVYTTKIVKK